MDRKRIAVGIVFVALTMATGVGTAAASDQSAVMASVQQFIDAYNRADFTAAARTCASPATVVDEFAPHIWTGPTACADWGKAYQQNAKQYHITHGTVTAGKPWQLVIDGDRAYVVLPVQFHWLQDGKPAAEPSSVYTLVLGKKSSGWRIMAWTWSEHVVEQ